jgi:hypothetical protein
MGGPAGTRSHATPRNTRSANLQTTRPTPLPHRAGAYDQDHMSTRESNARRANGLDTALDRGFVTLGALIAVGVMVLFMAMAGAKQTDAPPHKHHEASRQDHQPHCCEPRHPPSPAHRCFRTGSSAEAGASGSNRSLLRRSTATYPADRSLAGTTGACSPSGS